VFSCPPKISWELAGDVDRESARRRVAQALLRVDKFERTAGVPLTRVMGTPHGVCRKQMLSELAALGFEGACVAGKPIRRWATDVLIPPTCCMKNAEFLHGTLPVIPRFEITPHRTEIYRSILLGLPIVPSLHHWDFAGSRVDSIRPFIGAVSRLADVPWGSLKTFKRPNYLHPLKATCRGSSSSRSTRESGQLLVYQR
jgi:hypothetical protein